MVISTSKVNSVQREGVRDRTQSRGNQLTLAQERKHLVGRVAGHEIDTRTDVRSGNELEGQGIATSGDTIGARVGGTVKRAVRSAGLAIRAESGIPCVSGVAISVAASKQEVVRKKAGIIEEPCEAHVVV